MALFLNERLSLIKPHPSYFALLYNKLADQAVCHKIHYNINIHLV